MEDHCQLLQWHIQESGGGGGVRVVGHGHGVRAKKGVSTEPTMLMNEKM